MCDTAVCNNVAHVCAYDNAVCDTGVYNNVVCDTML